MVSFDDGQKAGRDVFVYGIKGCHRYSSHYGIQVPEDRIQYKKSTISILNSTIKIALPLYPQGRS